MALRTRGIGRSFPAAFTSTCDLSAWSQVRGPKKKKGPSKSEAPESSDIVNIFKDRPDPEIYATSRYPPWLIKMIEETYSPDDVMMQMYRGERIPTGPEQWTLVKSFRRTYLNDQNRYMKEEILYESDEEAGEDTGALEEEDITQAVASGSTEATPAAGGAEKKEEKKEEGGGAGAGAAGAAK